MPSCGSCMAPRAARAAARGTARRRPRPRRAGSACANPVRYWLTMTPGVAAGRPHRAARERPRDVAGVLVRRPRAGLERLHATGDGEQHVRAGVGVRHREHVDRVDPVPRPRQRGRATRAPRRAPPLRRAAPPHLRRPSVRPSSARPPRPPAPSEGTTLQHRTHIWVDVPDGLVLTGCPAESGTGGAPQRPPNPLTPESASLVRSPTNDHDFAAHRG